MAGIEDLKQKSDDQLQEQLMSIAESASFSGENWVAGDAAVKSVVSGFVRASDGTVSVKTTAYTLDDTATGNLLFGGDGAGAIVDTNGILGVPLAVPQPGEMVEPASPPSVKAWWRAVAKR